MIPLLPQSPVFTGKSEIMYPAKLMDLNIRLLLTAVSQVRVLFGAPITKHHPNGWCFVVSELKRTRRTSGTEQQSGGLLRPRATKRPQAHESSPVVSTMKKALLRKSFFQRNPPIRAGEMLLRNVKYALRRVKCLRARVDFISLSL